jgi:membrane-associated phospholipid phosphatase
MYFVFGALIARVQEDPAKIATVIRVVSERSRLFIHAFLFNVVSFAGIVIFSYLAASTAFPLQDALFASIDKALGFDWMRFLELTNANPYVASVLSFVYSSTRPQVIVLFVFLSLTGRRHRLAETLALLAICSVATALLSLPLPAAGAAAYYQPSPAHLTNFAPLSGMWHYQAFADLRGAAPRLDFETVTGVVQFPSFHTILALIITYAVRDVRWLVWPVAALNAAVIVATLPEGGHHLVDVIGGFAVVVGAIWIVRALEGRSQNQFPATLPMHS